MREIQCQEESIFTSGWQMVPNSSNVRKKIHKLDSAAAFTWTLVALSHFQSFSVYGVYLHTEKHGYPYPCIPP